VAGGSPGIEAEVRGRLGRSSRPSSGGSGRVGSDSDEDVLCDVAVGADERTRMDERILVDRHSVKVGTARDAYGVNDASVFTVPAITAYSRRAIITLAEPRLTSAPRIGR
jgi:hypothetical protein